MSDICVIGAGSSGVTTAKALLERGLSVEIIEKGSQLGGMWRYENDNGMSSAYRSLHIDSSRKSLGYPDFPIADDKPDFLSHRDVLEYLEAYAQRFGVREHVRFGTEVRRVEPTPDGRWSVTLDDGDTREYRAVVVANGHLWDPRRAQFPGRFDGESLHSHHYRTPTSFEGKRVLVVGFGNSAVDIAVDLCRSASAVLLSTRRGAWVMPKYILGIPTDRWGAFLGRRLGLPVPVVRAITSRLAYLTNGDQRRFGVPRPAHPVWREHACVSQDLLPYCGHGWIRMKPDVARLDGNAVEFVDGSRETLDVVIYATGYRTTFPFLRPELFEVRDNQARLYRRIAVPERPGLYFAGLVQPIGPTIPLVEIQGRWIAAVLSGALRLPAPAVMQAEIDAHHAALAKRYVGSARYTLEVDFRAYSKQLAADMRG